MCQPRHNWVKVYIMSHLVERLFSPSPYHASLTLVSRVNAYPMEYSTSGSGISNLLPKKTLYGLCMYSALIFQPQVD